MSICEACNSRVPEDALYFASKFNHLLCIEYIIKTYNPPHGPEMHAAVSRGSFDALRLLVQLGRDVNYTQFSNTSVLFKVVHKPDLVKMLINAKADVNCSSTNISPLRKASLFGLRDSALLLLQHEAIVNDVEVYDWVFDLKVKVDKSQRACISATIALMRVMRVKRVPKDLTKYVARIFFNENKLGEGWLL